MVLVADPNLDDSDDELEPEMYKHFSDEITSVFAPQTRRRTSSTRLINHVEDKFYRWNDDDTPLRCVADKQNE